MSDTDEDELDFLIRSTSSLLNLVAPKATESQSYDDDHKSPVGQLDGIALLFVTGDPKDVAAVAASVTSETITLYSVSPATDTAIQAETVLLPKNSKGDPPSRGTPVRQIRPVPCEDWMDECLTGGPLAPADHVLQLEYLIKQFYEDRDKSNSAALHQDIRRYIYYQCLPKIKGRLKLPIAQGYASTFFDIITNDQILSLKNIAAQFSPTMSSPPDKLQRHDETWLRNAILKTLRHDIPLIPVNPESPAIINHLLLDAASIEYIFGYFRETVNSAKTHIEAIHALRRSTGKNQARETLTKELDLLIVNMVALSQLVHYSVSFWHVLNNYEVVDVFRRYWDDPKKSTPEQNDVGNPICASDEGEDREENCKPPVNGGPREAITRWLKSTCQWSTTLVDIKSSRFGKLLLSRPFHIRMIQPTLLPEPSKQASLLETLSAIPQLRLSPTKLAVVLKTLKKLAEDYISQATPSEPNIITEKWEVIASDDQTAWQAKFTGSIHCECMIAWEMEQGSVIQHCSENIGVSNRCCYTCRLSHLPQTPQPSPHPCSNTRQSLSLGFT